MLSVSSYTVSMTDWICGATCFNCRTHSTPFIPGRLISISTTSGRSLGKPSSAASALGYWLTHLNPSARPITRAKVPRNWSLSSTMETEIGMVQPGQDDEPAPSATSTPTRLGNCRQINSSTAFRTEDLPPDLFWRQRLLCALFGNGEARLERSASAAFQAADAAGYVDLLIHVHPHWAPAAAEIALDTFPGVETQVEQAEAIE